ncbi:hypothetical protein J6T93_08440 [bacterium]|nr:hypothetical protein [bacterium]
MTNPRLVRRLPLFSSLFLAVLIVTVASAYSYRDHALFTEYARTTAIREGNTLLSGFHNWVGRGRFRNMALSDFTNATAYVCRNSSASIYSFLMPNMQVFNAGMTELPMRYLAELKDKSVPTNGFRAFHFTSADGRYVLFCTPVFTYYLTSGTRRNLGVNSYSNVWEENIEVQNRRKADIRYFCRLLTGSSCHFELLNMKGDDLPLAIIGIPTETYSAFVNPRRVHGLIFLAIFAVITFFLIFIVSFTREKASVERSLQMAEEQNAALQTEKIFNDRLVTIGRAAAAIAHDLRNPLSSIRGFIELFKKHAEETKDEVYAKHSDVMLREIDRLNNRITGILNFAKPDTLNLQRCKIKDFLDQLVAMEDSDAQSRGVDLVIDLGPDLPEIMLDEAVFMRAALNLCVNAYDAMPYGGELRIRCRNKDGDLSVAFQDSGSGIKPEIMEHLFDPFITSKAEGSGLGLASVEKAVTEHKGTITARNSATGGAIFEIILPAADTKKK